MMSAEPAERPEVATTEATTASPQSTPLDEIAPLKGLTFFQKVALFCAPLMFALFGWGGGTVFHDRVTSATAPVAAPLSELDGVRLYAQHCATCHGVRGDGKGVAAVYPPARHFGFERFKFAHTLNGIPTDQDLTNIIKNGIPGSAMPGFPQLTESETNAIIGHVRNLTWSGAYARFLKKAVIDFDGGGDEPDPSKIAKQATAFCRIEKPIPVPDSYPKPTPESLERGRKVYLASCVSCHGDKGKGDGPQVKDLKNEDGTPNVPRDLTSGVFKGGGDPHILFSRIRLGIPGTPMPATPTLSNAEMFDLINYVRAFSQPPAAVASPAAAISSGK
jgi:mono/diheme cytochrome c family protein